MKTQFESKMNLKTLISLRDELELQLHLFDSEARQKWEVLEKDWQLIHSEIEGLKPAAMQVKLALQPFLEKIEISLIQIREGLQRHHNVT